MGRTTAAATYPAKSSTAPIARQATSTPAAKPTVQGKLTKEQINKHLTEAGFYEEYRRVVSKGFGKIEIEFHRSMDEKTGRSRTRIRVDTTTSTQLTLPL